MVVVMAAIPEVVDEVGAEGEETPQNFEAVGVEDEAVVPRCKHIRQSFLPS